MDIYQIYMIWFGLVLWHVNDCWLFNAKGSLYIYFRYIWIGLFWFCGMFNPYLGPISDATTPGQSGLRSDDNERLLHFPQTPALLEGHH